MGAIRSTLVKLLSAAFLLGAFPPAPAAAQGGPDEALAFTSTGDALWDTYAQTVLNLLAESDDPSMFFASLEPPELPEGVLDGWAERFGDDPRYWQLCYWYADRGAQMDAVTGPAPGEYLRQGIMHGAADEMTWMLLYNALLTELNENWDLYCSGDLPEGSDFQPVNAGRTTPYTWYVEQRFELADELLAACPDESWAWYERAKVGFEYGRWEQALDDLRRGNTAANNRWPRPFPLRYIDEQALTGADCGSPVAAGIVLQCEVIGDMPNFLRYKDMLNDQFVRSSIGTDLAELTPWHGYICRFGSMEGTRHLYWSLAGILHGMLLDHLLDTPGSFTTGQLTALEELDARGAAVKDLSKAAMSSDLNDLTTALDQVCARYGVEADTQEAPEFLASYAGHDYLVEIASAPLAYSYRDYRRSYGGYYPQVRDIFNALATFDWENYCWPAGE